jgi:hypothetical protein
LRPSYTQSYRDLAASYQEVKNYKKSASIYARYQYLRNEKLIKVTDSMAINTIVERELYNLLAHHVDRIADVNGLAKRNEKYVEFDGTRLVFEWNDSEAEFDLQFVNPKKHYHKWEHTMIANADRINEEKMKGYSSEEFLMDNSLPGAWQINVNYKGNKRLKPTYLKATIYHNYGKSSERKEVKVFRLNIKNVNRELFELHNSSKVLN